MKTEQLIEQTNRIPGMHAQLNNGIVEFYDKECEDSFYAYPTNGLHMGDGISRMQHLKTVKTEDFIAWGSLLEEYVKSTLKERGLPPNYTATDGTGFYSEKECKQYDKKHTMIEKTKAAMHDIKRIFDNAPDSFMALAPTITLDETRNLMEFEKRAELEAYAQNLGLEAYFEDYCIHISLDSSKWYRDFDHILNGKAFQTEGEREAFQNKEKLRLEKKTHRMEIIGSNVAILPRINEGLGGGGKIVDIDENNPDRFLVSFYDKTTGGTKEEFFDNSKIIIV